MTAVPAWLDEAPVSWDPEDNGHQPYLAPIVRPVPGKVHKVNAAELLGRGLPVLEYLPLLGRNGYIVKGWTTLIAGYPKGGKTELLTRLCRDWRAERILYVTEEPEAIWAHRLHTLGGRWAHLTLLLGLGMEPADILAEIAHDEASVVVIDTVRNILQIRDETDNSEVARVLAPLIATCRAASKTLLLTHHIRKGGGQHGEGITGGHAFLGIVDCGLEVLRDPNLTPHQRRIRGWGRLHPIREIIYALNDDGTMQALGDPQELQLEQVKCRVLDTLNGEWSKTRDVYEALGELRPGIRSLRDALNALAMEGLIERDPREDRPGGTYFYRLSQPDLARAPL